MKNFVLGALLVAAASSAACSASTDVTVTAHWSFTHLADKSPRSCPVGFDTAEITAQPVDRETAAANGGLITTTAFRCNDLQGTIVVPDGVYLMAVDFVDGSGRPYTAKPEERFVDTATDSGFDVEILDDGGYFEFTWGLQQGGAAVTCAQANLASGTVRAISTNVASQDMFMDQPFPCTDHYGITPGLVAGTYTVSINAETGAGAVGEPVNLANEVITAPNGITDLGHITIPIN